jgi:carboxyl-terminal processing protease
MKLKTPTLILTAVAIGIASALIFSVGFMAGRATSTFSASALAADANVDPDTFQPYIQAWNILNKKYIDQPLDPDTLIQGSISGMLDSLGDPYTSYIDPETFAQENASLDGEYTGIGAWVDTSGDRLVIISPMPDSPAEKAGIRPGDVVVAIDGESMEGLTPTQALERILGPADSVILLTISREGSDSLLEFELQRAVIPLPSIASEMLDDETGYVQIFTFANNTYADFAMELKGLVDDGAQHLIIDLRNNPGGLVDSAQDIASIFLEDKVVLIEEWGDGRKTEYRTTQATTAPDLPVYVLVNQGTASASEILAGALQDYGRATLIGNTTFGKGLIQNWIPLDGDYGAVRITIAKWLTPNGRQIQDLGLEPDFSIDYTIEDFDAGMDPQLEKALELISEKK